MDSNKRLKIVLAIYSLSAGGAERVITTMANYWALNGFQVTVLTQVDEPPFYKLHSAIRHISLRSTGKSNNGIDAFLRNIKTIIKLIKIFKVLDTDFIVSFMTSTNILCIIAARFMNIPVVVSERYNPYKFRPNKFWLIARKIWYPKANFIVVQSQQAANYFSSFCKMKRIKIIYNPIKNIEMDMEFFKSPEPIILSVGRLHFVKGHDLLIRAFAKARIKGWKLCIVGEGNERSKLEVLIKELGLNDTVYLPGMSENVEEYYLRAGIFVLSSRAEGFPNCLVEAMSYGLPVISTNCETGPSVIISNMENGLLVPNKEIDSLADAMKFLVENPSVRQKFGEHAKKSVNIYKVEAIMDQWNELIKRSIEKNFKNYDQQITNDYKIYSE